MTDDELRWRVELSEGPETVDTWAWTDVSAYVERSDPPKLTVTPSQATFTPNGGLHYPPPRRWTVWVIRPDGTRRLLGAKRLPWWRRIWRRRG